METNANLMKWCVHILGPDDVQAAPSHLAASYQAHEMNKLLYSRADRKCDDILCFAYAAPWPHSKESHDGNVKAWPNFIQSTRLVPSDSTT
jgi:hypothetical protein